MHIALVRSPSSSLRADYSVPLRRYFRSPRLLSLGDLIPVVLPSPRYPFVRDFFQDGQGTEEGDQDDDEEDEEDEEQDETGQQENRDCQGGDLVYFKVTRGTAFLVLSTMALISPLPLCFLLSAHAHGVWANFLSATREQQHVILLREP